MNIKYTEQKLQHFLLTYRVLKIPNFLSRLRLAYSVRTVPIKIISGQIDWNSKWTHRTTGPNNICYNVEKTDRSLRQSSININKSGADPGFQVRVHLKNFGVARGSMVCTSVVNVLPEINKNSYIAEWKYYFYYFSRSLPSYSMHYF